MAAIRHLKITGCFLLVMHASFAATWYVDPDKGSIENDGSEAEPWSTLEEVFESGMIATRMYETKPAELSAPMVPKNEGAPVGPGDTILLMDGYHGDVYAAEYYNEDYVTIMACPGNAPRVAGLELRSGCKWRVAGLTVSPSFADTFRVRTLINFSPHSWTGPSRDCIAEACTAFTVASATDWTMEQWDTLSCDGMSLPGNKMAARNNVFRNVNFGISVTGDSCLVEYNTVENFAGDGLRGLGDYCTFQYNRITNCYAVNGNHDDGFQSWSVGDDGVGTGVVYGVILRGNTIVNYEDPKQPFLGTLQGIGCFDGMFESWRVENNVIMTDHWHGITLSGATDCIIINNTVVDLNEVEPGPPWVRFSDHKDGRHCSGCVIRNNLTTKVNSSSEGVTSDHNVVIDDYGSFFVDYAAGDLRLKPGCSAIGAGSSDGAPKIDRAGNPRPAGGGIDAGAYEYSDAGVINRGRQVQGMKIITTETFSRYTRITFTTAVDVLFVYDCNGNEVFHKKCEGMKTVQWDTRNCSSGSYVVSATVKGTSIWSKLCIIR